MSATSDLGTTLRQVAAAAREHRPGNAYARRWFEVGVCVAVQAIHGVAAAEALDDLLADRDPADEIAPDDDED